MLKAFSYLQKLLTIFVIGLILMQGVFSLNQITANAADGVATGNDNISSLNNCAVYLSGGVLQFKTAEVASRSGDVGPCVDDAGKLFYECTDTDVTHSGISNFTKASCKRSSSAPATCYTLAGRLLGTGDRKLTINNTPECKIAFTETCANIWDSGNGGSGDQCKLLYNNVKPIVGVIADNGTTSLAKCNTNFTAQDDADLAKRNIKKDALGKYPVGTCKDDSGKLLICNSVQVDNKYVNCKAANEEAKGNNAVVQSKVDDKSLGDGLIGIFLGILSIILLVIFYILNWALSFLLWMLGLVFINILVINPVSVEYIEVAKAPWQILVNIANLLTLASLIFVGIGYILNIKSLKIGIQQLLLNVTIFSLLLNFTLLGLQGVTTITQGLGDAMITARSGQPPAFLSGGQNILLDSVLTGIKGISLIRCGNENLNGLAIKCQTGTTIKEKETATDANGFGEFGNLTTAIGKDTGDILAGKIGDKVLRAMMLEVVYTMVLIYAIITLFKGSMMVLIRLVAFWLLLIVSPLALAAYFMPVPSIKKYAGQWAEKTWQLAVFYPVAILLLILISEIVSQFSNAINKSIGGAATAATGTANLLNTVQVYAATGDFGGVFTAMVSTVLVGFIGVVAFGTMSAFMDKFLGPIAKALGDGIKSAASALGTAGYIGGSAIRMGAGAANKMTGGALGAITNRFGGAKTAEKMKNVKQSLRENQKQLRANQASNIRNNRMNLPLLDNSKLENKIKSQKRDYIGLKGSVQRRDSFNKGVDKVKNNKYTQKTLKFNGFGKKGFGAFDTTVGGTIGGLKNSVPSLGNSLLNTMQYGVNDVSNLVATGGLLWKSLGTKRKAQEAERKKMAEGRLEAYLAKRQEGNPLYQDLLAYSPELNMLDGKYKPGEEFKLSDEEVKKLIKDESRRHGDKVGGINRDTTLGQAKELIKKYQTTGYENLDTIQRNNLRDIYEKAEKDKSFAESLSLDTENQNFLAENAYAMLGSVGIKSFAKAAPQLLANSQGGVGSEDQTKIENVAIRDELQSFARSYAQASPDSQLRRDTNASSLLANPVIMETIDGINPELGKQMRQTSKLDKDFNASYSQVEAYKKAGKYRDSDPEMYQGIVSAASARASNGYSSTPQLRVRLAQAGDDKVKQDASYAQFYTDEYGTETVNQASIDGLTLEQLKNSNLGRVAIAKLPKFDQLTEVKQREYLISNAQAAWGAFGRTENSFKQGINLNVKEASEIIESNQNRSGLAESSRNVQSAVARVANNGGVSQIRELRENGRVISDLNKYNSSVEGNEPQVNLTEEIRLAMEEERVAQIAPLQIEYNNLNGEINTLTTEVTTLETERVALEQQLATDQAILGGQNLDTMQQEKKSITNQIERFRSGDTMLGVNSSQRINELKQSANILEANITNFEGAQTRASRREMIDSTITNNNEQINLVSASRYSKQAEIQNLEKIIGPQLDVLEDVTKLGEGKVLARVQKNSSSYLQGVVNSSGGKFTASDAQRVGKAINVKDTTYSGIKLIADNQNRTDYAQALKVQAGDDQVSYETMLSIPEIDKIATKSFKILKENGKLGNLDVSTDGRITSSVVDSFQEGASKILTDLSSSIRNNEEYDTSKFEAALTNPNNASWANTSLGEQFGNMMGFENKKNSSGVVELVQNPNSSGILTRKALIRSGEETSAKIMNQARNGYQTLDGGIGDISNKEAKAAAEAVTATQVAGVTRDAENAVGNLVRVIANTPRTT